jgi:ATP-dependent exoDNAse (exonuclease V) beta subunit
MIARACASHLEKLDDSQRLAATIDVNAVVTAGAGAGKTTVLAARYAHLVIDQKIPVRSILALTFTRKAAAEMYERIYLKLSESDSAWAREQLADFGQARISTLDSFCAEIVRQGASEYGYSPDFAIDDEKCADIARSVAQRYVLGNLDEPGIEKMLESYQLDDIVQSLFAEIGSGYVTPIAIRENLFTPMISTLASLYSCELTKRTQRLSELCREIVSHDSDAGDKRADCRSAIDAAQRYLMAGENTAVSLEPLLSSLANLQMRAYGKSPPETAVKELAKQGRDVALTLLDFANYERLVPTHNQLLRTLDDFSREVAEAKRRADVMNFNDLGCCAVHLLTRRKDLRQKWKSSIRRIMIDEFQDNNSLQRDLLYLLAEKLDESSPCIPQAVGLEAGKLFFVGDEKQSIYRFRGADVSVFKSLARGLGSSSGTNTQPDIALSTNYRSTVGLVDFFNRVFPSVMERNPQGIRGTEQYEAEYSAMIPGPGATLCPDFPSRIELIRVGGDEPDLAAETDQDLLDKDDAVAFEVARAISKIRGNLPLRGSVADYSDIAILLRTTTHQHRIERFLRRMDIPFESENPKGLFRESPASDIYSILAFGENPDDKIAFAAVLRSPLCRVSDEAFVLLLSLENDFLKNAQGLALGPEDRKALENLGLFIDLLEKHAGSGPLSDLISIIWHKGGLAAELESKPESQPFLEHFDFLFHLAAGIEARGGGVVDFLDTLRPLLSLEEDKLELNHVPRHSGRGVRIMTIHKAKGLQFPVVIIPWIENTGSSRRNQALWQMLPEGLAIDLKPYDVPGASSKNIFFDMAREIEASKAKAELKRLFYVACTRAEDHLFFFGKTPRNQDLAGTSFLSLLDTEKLDTKSVPRTSRKEASRFAEKVASPLPHPSRPEMADDAPTTPARIPATRVNEYAIRSCMSGMPPLKFTKATQIAPQNGPADTIGIAADAFGTLCHEAVEFAIQHGNFEGFSPGGPPPEEKDRRAYEAAVLESIAYAQAFIDSPFWSSLSLDAKIQTEKPFLLGIRNFVIDGRIDLFIETTDSIAIVDFKSDAKLEPERYAIQLQIYHDAAEGFRPGKKVLTGLYDLRRGDLLWHETTIPEQTVAKMVFEALQDDGTRLDRDCPDLLY